MIFISYAKEDIGKANKIYHDLKNHGVDVWIDSECLLPGQDFDAEIANTIKKCNLFLALLSSNSLTKVGLVQKELKIALNMLEKFPSNEIFIIPVRLEECFPVDDRLARLHFADVFDSYEHGFTKILKVVELKKLPKNDSRIRIAYNEIIYDQIKKLEYENYNFVPFQYVAPFETKKLYVCPRCGATCQRYAANQCEYYAEQSMRACLQCGWWVYAYVWDDLMGDLADDHLQAAIGLTRDVINFPHSCPLWKNNNRSLEKT